MSEDQAKSTVNSMLREIRRMAVMEAFAHSAMRRVAMLELALRIWLPALGVFLPVGHTLWLLWLTGLETWSPWWRHSWTILTLLYFATVTVYGMRRQRELIELHERIRLGEDA